jgi:uncharacterized protein involved in exopolysaccharide biosynthesis
MIKSYWLRILMCGLAAAIVGFLIGVVTKPQYDAELQVVVAPYFPVGSPSMSEADDAVKSILDSSAPRTIQTQVDMLTSSGTIQEAARKVALDRNLSYTDPNDELYPYELQNKVSVTSAKESDVVSVHVRGSTPDLAQQLATEIYNAFDKQNKLQSRSSVGNAVTFLTTQDEQIQKELLSIENEVTKAQTEAGAPDIDQQMIADIQRLRDLEMQLDQSVANESAALTRSNNLKRQMQGMPDFVEGSQTMSENPRFSALTQALIAAEADRETGLEKYLPDSVEIKALDRRIATLKKMLAGTPEYKRGQTGSGINPTLQALRTDYQSALALVPTAQANTTALRIAVARQKAEMAKLPALKQKLDELKRKQLVLERISQLYTSKLKTLELAKTAPRSATYLVSPAQAMRIPSVPNYGLNVGLGMFLGLAIGFLWSISSESKRNPIRSLGQLNRLSLQPCYRVIPELRVPMRGLNRAPAEVFDSLLVNFVRSEKKGYKLGVLGVTRAAGATTTAMNLAISAARGGYSVLFVEVDAGNNAAAKLTGDAKSPAMNIAIFNGPLGTHGGGTNGWSADLEVAAKGKDLVIFDFAPVKVSGDSFLLASQLDEMILLVRQNVTRSVDFLQAQQALIDAGCPIVNVALSRLQDQSDDISALEQQSDVRSIAPQA